MDKTLSLHVSHNQDGRYYLHLFVDLPFRQKRNVHILKKTKQYDKHVESLRVDFLKSCTKLPIKFHKSTA